MKIGQRFFSLLLVLCFWGAEKLSADTPLEEVMVIMKTCYKELSKGMENPKETDKKKYLQLTAILHDASVKARELSPEKTDEIPAEKRASFIKAYQKKIDEMIVTVDLLDKAIKDSNWSEAKKQIADLKQDQKEGHKEYRSEKHH